MIARLALPAAVLVTLVRGWMSPLVARHLLLHLAAGGVAAVLGGYVAGVVLWELVVNRGGRVRQPRPPEPPQPPDPTRRPRSRHLPPPRI